MLLYNMHIRPLLRSMDQVVLIQVYNNNIIATMHIPNLTVSTNIQCCVPTNVDETATKQRAHKPLCTNKWYLYCCKHS